jgi:hypothetical protein
MKKNQFFLMFFAVFPFCLGAQMHIGVKAGGNFTSILQKDNKDAKFKPGFHAGAIFEYDINNALSFQPEVVYSVKGYKYKSSTTVLNITSEHVGVQNLSYLDIPALLNIHFGEMGSYIGLGPQLSLLMSARFDEEITNSNPAGTTTFTNGGDNKEVWNGVDFGAVFGLGSKFAGGIEYNLRAAYGLSNAVHPDYASDNPVHNLCFSVSLGYTFDLGDGGKDRYGRKYKKRR